MLAFLRTLTLTRTPGERFEYSNLGVGLLGYALSQRASRGYEPLVSERILAPLGLRETVVTLTPALRTRLAPGHDAEGNAAANWDLDALAGAGALRSTASDMLDFLAANVAAARGDTARPVARALAVSHRWRAEAGPNVGIGLGWIRLTVGADTIVWHNGGTGGYTSFAAFNPATGAAVVVLSNRATTVDDIGVHVLTGRPLRPPPAWPATIAIDTATAQRYEGRYALGLAAVIDITRDGTQLRARLTGQDAYRVYPFADAKFFLKIVDAQLEFEVPADGGSATAVTLVQNGIRQRAVRLAPQR